MPVLVGTSGWQYRDWRGRFYPERLATVESNNAFYRLPEADTFAAWSDRTPPDFVMAVKASRFLTHVKRLRDPSEPVARFLGHAAYLGGKLGPVLLQLPPSLRADAGLLDATLACFPAGVRVAVEPRHQSWFSDQVLELLRERGAAMCLTDRARRRWPGPGSRPPTCTCTSTTTTTAAPSATRSASPRPRAGRDCPPPGLRPSAKPPSPPRVQPEGAGDEDAHHLAGALADLQDLGVAVEARHRELVHVAVAAVHLDRLARGGHRRLRGVQLGDRGQPAERLAGGQRGGRPLPGQPGGVGPQLHVGDLEGDRLEGGDRLAEGLPLPRVLHAFVDAALAQPGPQ